MQILTLARQMEECVTVSQSVFITNIVTTPMMPWPLAGANIGPVWRRYLFICCHQICIQLVNNTQWQLNGPVCTQNIEPTRALFGLNICSILSFLWTQRRPGETLWRVLTADSSNYLLLISAKRDEPRKFIINNPSHEWHWAQITAQPAPGLLSLCLSPIY